MAGSVDTTAAPLCAQISDQADPINLLLDLMERQTAGWEALPEDDDALRSKVAALTWDETGALLQRFQPTTMTGAIRALRHVVERIAPDDGGGPNDYTLPLARNAVTALERMVGA
jgi:hypothetical protein